MACGSTKEGLPRLRPVRGGHRPTALALVERLSEILTWVWAVIDQTNSAC